jgi:hypothetical protein
MNWKKKTKNRTQCGPSTPQYNHGFLVYIVISYDVSTEHANELKNVDDSSNATK